MDKPKHITRDSSPADIVLFFVTLFMLVILFNDIMTQESWSNKTLTFLGLAIPTLPYVFKGVDRYVFDIGILNNTLIYWKYSSSAFMVAILVDRTILLDVAEEGLTSSIALAFTIIGLLGIISFGSYFLTKAEHHFERQKNRADALEERLRNIEQAEIYSGIMDFGSLLEEVESKNGDLLAVGGNLLSLSTSKGMRLLNNFLCGGNKEVYLFIPDEAKKRLSYIKENIDEESYLRRITPVVYEPFMFLQGVVIVGHRGPDGDEEAIGCYFYKPRFYEEQEMAEEGIFIDLNEVTSSKREGSRREAVACRSVSAYLSLLKQLRYRWTSNMSTYSLEKDLCSNDTSTTIGWNEGRENIIDWNNVEV